MKKKTIPKGRPSEQQLNFQDGSRRAPKRLVHIIITLWAKIPKFNSKSREIKIETSHFHHRYTYCELSENAEILSTGGQFASKNAKLRFDKNT